MLVGRDNELAEATAMLDRAATASPAVVVRGVAGIGKTAVLGAVVDAARDRGFGVLTARPTRAESPLGFAALGDLTRGLDLDPLADRQRWALEVAVGRRIAEMRPPETTELALALTDALAAHVGGAGPVLVVVDDVQWIDTASRDVLAFVARRLPVGVCLAVGHRTTPPEAPDGVAGFDVREARVVELGPLDPGAIAHVLDHAAGRPLPQFAVDRIVAAAAGNPFYARELARSVDLAALGPGRPLPLPRSLAAVTAGRVAGLPAATRTALAAVSLLARPAPRQLHALGMLADLEPAEQAAIVEVDAHRIAFTHPLLASAAHDSIVGTARLALHLRLAGVVDGIERSRHLALGTDRPDAATAASLSTASRHELSRGALAEAADLAMLALDATPADDRDRWRRQLTVADLLFRTGRTDAAIAEIEVVLAAPPGSEARTRALLALATIEYSRIDDGDAAAALAREALAGTDAPELQADAHTIIARVAYDDFDAAAHHADRALSLLRRSTRAERHVLAAAIHSSGTARFLAGDGLDRAAFDEAIELEHGADVPLADSAYAALAANLKYADELDESCLMLDALVEQADPGSLPYALSHLPQLHLWAGRWDTAEECARRHLWLAERAMQESQVYAARFNLAMIAANRGDLAESERIGRQQFDEGRAGDVPWTERNGAALLGFVAMSAGDAEAAVEYLRRYDDLGERMHLREPGYARLIGDYVEALVATGDHEAATVVVDRLDRRARRLTRPSAQATVLRSRALLAAAAGDQEHALAAGRAAVAVVEGTPLAYEHARALLTLGIVARRLKARGVARQALAEACAELERMGAASLTARARRELERVGGRADGVAALTPGEASVAELAAGGATTRQIADSLFISAKTVEANLTRIYRKLGISNRAQLAHALAAGRTEM